MSQKNIPLIWMFAVLSQVQMVFKYTNTKGFDGVNYYER